MNNELIDFKRIWDVCLEKWRTSFGAILLSVVAFCFGMVFENKTITDDCKFAKTFRDGAHVYDCQVRIR